MQGNARDVEIAILYEAMQKLFYTMSASVENRFEVFICCKVRKFLPLITSHRCDASQGKDISRLKHGDISHFCLQCLVYWNGIFDLEKEKRSDSKSI